MHERHARANERANAGRNVDERKTKRSANEEGKQKRKPGNEARQTQTDKNEKPSEAKQSEGIQKMTRHGNESAD